jgi:hypothetical protein
MTRAIEPTAYTDRDRERRLRSERAILTEYMHLKLPPVRVGGVLLSPALVNLLQTDELEKHPEEAR